MGPRAAPLIIMDVHEVDERQRPGRVRFLVNVTPENITQCINGQWWNESEHSWEQWHENQKRSINEGDAPGLHDGKHKRIEFAQEVEAIQCEDTGLDLATELIV